MRVFISYSHQDSPFANRLAQDLQKRKFEVWIDEHNQLPFALGMQVVTVGPGTFTAVSEAGDQLVCQKTA